MMTPKSKKIKYNGGRIEVDVYNDNTYVYTSYDDSYHLNETGSLLNKDQAYVEKLSKLITEAKRRIDATRADEVLQKQRLEEAVKLANLAISDPQEAPQYVPTKRRGLRSALRDIRKRG